MSIRKRRGGEASPPESVAGNGLLHRRALLRSGIAFAGAMGAGGSLTGAAAEPLKDDPWSLEMGTVVAGLSGSLALREGRGPHPQQSDNEFRNSHARTPHHLLQGTVTPMVYSSASRILACPISIRPSTS